MSRQTITKVQIVMSVADNFFSGSSRFQEIPGGYTGEGACQFLRQAEEPRLGLKIGTNQSRFLGGFLKLSDAESVNFHRVPNQVLYQAEPLPD